MNLILRVFAIALRAIFSPPLAIDSISRVHTCVLPNDLDFNLHLNNGRYLSYFDLGKIDIMIRGGLAKVALANRWLPIVGGCIVRFRFSLRPFERVTVVTRVLGWDDKWFYVRQHIECRRGIAAVGLAKIIVRDREKLIVPHEILLALGIDKKSLPFPIEILKWLAADEALSLDDSQ